MTRRDPAASRIAVVGHGYVGLAPAVEFDRRFARKSGASQ